MFGIAGETEFDVRFHILGIPVRIHPVFWLSSALLAWAPAGGQLGLVFLGIVCVLVSILAHELGHAVMSRKFGYPSEIVLYFLGGYATSARFSTWKNVAVSAAGPGVGFGLFWIVYAVFAYLFANNRTLLIESDALWYVLNLMLFANLIWNAMNLIPCMPLDGGQIMQSLVSRYVGRKATERVVQVSIATSGAVALWSLICMQQQNAGNPMHVIPIPRMLVPNFPVGNLQPDPMFLAIFFGYMCAQHVMFYNSQFRRG